LVRPARVPGDPGRHRDAGPKPGSAASPPPTPEQLRQPRATAADLITDQFDSIGTAAKGCDLVLGARVPGSTGVGAADAAKSGYVLYPTADPDVFIAEIDAVLDVAGEIVTISLVQIFRLRDGKIALLRDYFAPDTVA
jgi:hypothetical protein